MNITWFLTPPAQGVDVGVIVVAVVAGVLIVGLFFFVAWGNRVNWVNCNSFELIFLLIYIELISSTTWAES